MRAKLAALAAILAFSTTHLGCDEPGRGPGTPCEDEAGCDDGLGCLEGLCARTFDDAGGEGPAEGGPVRLFAVGLHLTMEDVASQESFGDAIRAVVEETVVGELPADRPALLVFPEDTGLFAGFIGSRGEAARRVGSTASAFVALAGSYGEAADFYMDRASRSLRPGELVSLSITDTLWRSLETFAGLAAEHGVWLAVGYNVADAERTADPELVAALADEDASDRSYAWLALDEAVFNQTLLFDPTGELVARHRKEYLVPAEESSLNLAYGPPGTLPVTATPFGPLASAISKDAWMPDVLDRLALGGASLVLQLEAFSGWGVPHDEHGSWAPDVVKESGWAHVMLYPELRANVLPCLSGNLFEMFFDCQSTILVAPQLAESRGAWIGQDEDVGFARVAPWVVEDDGVGSLEERRARLVETGERLLPGSGDPMENQYLAGTVWMDLDLGAGWAEVDGAAGEPIDPAGEGEQRRPAVAALDDGVVVAVWEDGRRGQSRLYGARLGAGATGEARVRVPTAGEARAPSLAAAGQTVHLVWQELLGGSWAVRHARSDDGGRSFPEPVTLAGGDGTAAWVPRVALAGEAVHVVWADDAEGPFRVRYARSGDGGRGFEPARDLEPAPAHRYDTRQNRWEPTVAAEGEVVAVAWADFSAYRWEIRGAASPDGGASFGEPARLDDAEVEWETICSDPEGVVVEGRWLLAWTDLRVRRPDYDVRLRRLDPADLGSAPASVSLAGTDPRGRPQAFPALAARGGEVVVAFQDFREDRNELRLARSTDGGESFGPDEPLEGADLPGLDHYAPALGPLPGGGFALLFESTASGGRRVRSALLD